MTGAVIQHSLGGKGVSQCGAGGEKLPTTITRGEMFPYPLYGWTTIEAVCVCVCVFAMCTIFLL